MNIVFIVDHFNSKTDGTIITAKRFREELIRQGHSVKVVAYGATGENEINLSENKMPIVSQVAKKSNVTFAKFNKKVIAEAIKDADIVHLFLPFEVERKALRLAKKMNKPVSAAFHLHPDNILKNAGFKNPPKFLTNFIFWLWRVNFYDRVDHIHCPSAFTAEELMRHNYKATLHVISNGVAPHFAPLPDKQNDDKQNIANYEKFEILMVGRLAAEKRQDLLIEAVAKSKYREQINITFAGNGPLKQKLVALAEKLPNKPNFAFLSQDELIDKIHASDVYIHAADVEIEGISCIEAFSCGLVPIIGNAPKSATKQFVIDSRCGFEAGNAESLRSRIEYWFEHPEERAKMSETYAEYAKRFSLTASVRAAVSMFEDVIADAKSAEAHNLDVVST